MQAARKNQSPSERRIIFSAILLVCFSTLGLPGAQAESWPGAPSEADLQNMLAKLETYAVDRMRAEGVPGMAYAIVKDDQVIYSRGFGVRRLGEPDPVDENTLFEIGSITKSFTSTLVAMLVDEGKLNWSDRVGKYLPDFAMHERWVTREMQIEDVLCHRSGMPGYQLDNMLFLGFQPSQIVQAVRWVQPVTSFRTTFAYSNTLYQVAGQLIRERRGHDWAEDLNERLLQPLGMNASSGDPQNLPSANVAGGHIALSDGSLWVIPANWRYSYSLKNVGPAGSIVSNVVDMAQWLRFQLAGGNINGRQLVSPENLAVTRAPRTLITSDGSTFSASYAMGWLSIASAPQPALTHSGGTLGMSANLLFFPGAGVGIVVLTNAVSITDDNPVLLPFEVTGMFHQLYFFPDAGVNSAAAPANLPKAALPPSLAGSPIPVYAGPLAVARLAASVGPAAGRSRNKPVDYSGSYKNPAYGRIIVEVLDGNLVMTMGPAELQSPLVHYQGDVFVGTLPDYPQEAQFPVQFVVKDRGDVSGLIMPLLSDVNGGLFTKE